MGSVVSCEQNGSRLEKCLRRKNAFNAIGTPTSATYTPFFSACVAGFLVSVWFAGSGSSTCTRGGSERQAMAPCLLIDTRKHTLMRWNAHTGRYLSFFWDRLSSMYLYFWYCSSSFVRTASAVSLPGCFIKDSTSSCKNATKCVTCVWIHDIKRKTKQTNKNQLLMIYVVNQILKTIGVESK